MSIGEGNIASLTYHVSRGPIIRGGLPVTRVCAMGIRDTAAQRKDAGRKKK